MEHILFIAAEKEELDCAVQAYGNYREKLDDKVEVDWLLTGIGTTATSYLMTKAICEAEQSGHPFTLIIEIGLAGSYDLERLPVRSAAVITKEHFSDLGFQRSEGFRTLFDCNYMDRDAFPYTGGALERPGLPYVHVEELLETYRSGTGVTVQTVTGDPEKLEENKKKFQADIESMEGAAVYFVALSEHIPFFELRTVSNAVGVSDSSLWDNDGARKSLYICCNEILAALAEDLK